jgi:hypothetical protein
MMMATCSGMSRVSGTAWVELVAMDREMRGRPAKIKNAGEKPAPSFHRCCITVLRGNGKDGA